MSRGVGVDLEALWIRFGDFVAVRDANVNINGGDFFSFLGPSGCGKTTILRAVSGFLDPSEGNVLIGGKNMKGIGPNKRPTALIFQNLALFPLMTVSVTVRSAELSIPAPYQAELSETVEELRCTSLDGKDELNCNPPPLDTLVLPVTFRRVASTRPLPTAHAPAPPPVLSWISRS